MNSKEKPIISVLNTLYFLIPVAIAVTSFYVTIILMNKDTFKTETENVSEKKIENRIKNRGTIVFFLSGVLLKMIGAVMVAINVPREMLLENYGFIFGPTLGYMLDIGIATDEGLSRMKNNKLLGIKYVFLNLFSGKFIRYFITLLLELFISDPLIDILQTSIKETEEYLINKQSENYIWMKYNHFIGSNLPAIIQSIIAIISFQAYTKGTRFNWAYTSPELSEKTKINRFLICLSLPIAAILYLIHYKKDQAKIRNRLGFVILAFCLLWHINEFEIHNSSMDDIKDKDEEQTYDEKSIIGKLYNLHYNNDDNRFIYGIIVFVCLIIYGLVYPVITGFRNTAKKVD